MSICIPLVHICGISIYSQEPCLGDLFLVSSIPPIPLSTPYSCPPPCPPPPLSLADPMSVKKAAEALKAAKRPLVIIGKGTWSKSYVLT